MKLHQVTTFLWQWGWLILLGTAVAAATAYFTSQNMTPVYEAVATWLIDEPAKSETEPAASASSLPATYAVVALTRPVLAETAQRLDLPFGVEQLQLMVTAVAFPNSQLITIRVEDSDPGRAAHLANTVGEVLADQSIVRDSQRFAQPLANWQQQMDDSRAEIDTLKSLLAADDVTNRSQIESNLAAAQARYDSAFAQYNDLLAQQAGESVIMTPVEMAQASTTPVRPQTATVTLWAAVAGALATLVVAGLAQRAANKEAGSADTSATMSPLTMTSND